MARRTRRRRARFSQSLRCPAFHDSSPGSLRVDDEKLKGSLPGKNSRGDSAAWLAVDRLSSQWVSSHPTHRVELNAAEFGETFTTYMGCESRLVRPYTGR